MDTSRPPRNPFVTAFLHGLGAPAQGFVVNRYVYPHASDVAAMRGDWVRVGTQLKDAMARADVETAA